jgi:nicotinamidase-related amidase
MESHVCVYQTARDLLAQGYEVFVIADAVSSRTPENKEIGLKAMMQVGARIACVEMVLLDLMQVAEGDRFRQVLHVIK